MALIQKIDCVRFYVPDLEAGLNFYRDQLGLKLVWRTDTALGLAMPDTDAEIVLQTKDHAQDIDFTVESADAATAQFVQAGGTVIIPPFDIAVGRASVVRDPWGNQYVLMDLNKGTFITDADGNILGNQK